MSKERDIKIKSSDMRFNAKCQNSCVGCMQYVREGIQMETMCETVPSFRITNGKYIITVLNRVCNTRTHSHTD